VSGHVPLFITDKGIMKPASIRETMFYTELKDTFPALLPFVPRFFSIHIIHPTHVSHESSKENSPSRTPSPSISRNESISAEEEKRPPVPQPGHVNNWAHLCHEKTLTKISNGQVQCLELENLTSVYKKPCVLDLKLGTQQHSNDDPPEKIKSKQLKCFSTTSSSLGLRFCGSQVWMPQQQAFISRDKYYGRQLDADGFFKSLREFFFNGECMRFDIIRLILSRVQLLYDIISKQTLYQFRSSSLLLIYEGAPDVPVNVDKLLANPGTVSKDSTASSASPSRRGSWPATSVFPGVADMRLIDFAHTDRVDGQRDEGVTLGLSNLIRFLSRILDEPSK